MKDTETEVDKQKQYIRELQRKVPGAVYVPYKYDSIDRALAEYINNYPEKSKLKIMFMRELSLIHI